MQTKSQESALRARCSTALGAVRGDIEAMGWDYQRGQVFSYWPAWLPGNGDDG